MSPLQTMRGTPAAAGAMSWKESNALAYLPRARARRDISYSPAQARQILADEMERLNSHKQELTGTFARLRDGLQLLEQAESSVYVTDADKAQARIYADDWRTNIGRVREALERINSTNDTLQRGLDWIESTGTLPTGAESVSLLQGSVNDIHTEDSRLTGQIAGNTHREFLDTLRSNIARSATASTDDISRSANAPTDDTAQAVASNNGNGINGITSATQMHSASAETLATMFAQGVAVDNDTNHRRYAFSDGSFVDIRAHEPQVTTSATSKSAAIGNTLIGVGVGITAGTVFGAIAAALAGGPIGLAVGSILFMMGSAYGPVDNILRHANDLATQSYEIRAYAGAGGEPQGAVRYILGSFQSDDIHRPATIENETDPARFENLANRWGLCEWEDTSSAQGDLRSHQAGASAQASEPDQATAAVTINAAPDTTTSSEAHQRARRDTLLLTQALGNVPPPAAAHAQTTVAPDHVLAPHDALFNVGRGGRPSLAG